MFMNKMILINWYVNSDSFRIRKLRIASAVWWCLTSLPIEDRVQSHVLRLEPDPVPWPGGTMPSRWEARVWDLRADLLGSAHLQAGRGSTQGGDSGRNWVERSEGPDPQGMRPVTGVVPSAGLGPASGTPPAECPFPDPSFLRFSPGLGGQLGGWGTRPGSSRGGSPGSPSPENASAPAIHSGYLVEAAPEPGWGEPRGKRCPGGRGPQPPGHRGAQSNPGSASARSPLPNTSLQAQPLSSGPRCSSQIGGSQRPCRAVTVDSSVVGLPCVSNGKKNLSAMQETRVDPWVGKVPWRRAWQPTRVFLPGESHRQRRLAGYSPRGRKGSDTTGRLTSLPMLLWALKGSPLPRAGGLGPGPESSHAAAPSQYKSSTPPPFMGVDILTAEK